MRTPDIIALSRDQLCFGAGFSQHHALRRGMEALGLASGYKRWLQRRIGAVPYPNHGSSVAVWCDLRAAGHDVIVVDIRQVDIEGFAFVSGGNGRKTLVFDAAGYVSGQTIDVNGGPMQATRRREHQMFAPIGRRIFSKE